MNGEAGASVPSHEAVTHNHNHIFLSSLAVNHSGAKHVLALHTSFYRHVHEDRRIGVKMKMR